MVAIDRSGPALLRAVGLLPDGPGQWGRPLRAQGAGVFVVELPSPLGSAPLDHGSIGRWLERVAALRLDGARPTGRELLTRLASFWLPEETVLFIGSTTGSIGGRASAMARTELGERKPAPSGHWLHALKDPSILRFWWASTEAPEEYEDALLSEFAEGVGAAARAALPDSSVVLPWANLRTVIGERKATGITNPLVPDTSPPPPPPVSTIVELPPAEADGARDEAKRKARPAPGRGVGRVASAAAYAAQGSPRKAAPEPVYLSPEGRDRMQGELRQLVEVERPAVIKRIATAREHGDLKENAEYHAAREEQGFLENRIRTMEQTLKVATIVEPEARGAVVGVGTRLRVAHEGDELELAIVGSAEADPGAGRISNVSPVGRALIGRRVGDIVTVVTPGGDRRYEVLAIE
jgi:transcription elongation factor GreA